MEDEDSPNMNKKDGRPVATITDVAELAHMSDLDATIGYMVEDEESPPSWEDTAERGRTRKPPSCSKDYEVSADKLFANGVYWLLLVILYK